LTKAEKISRGIANVVTTDRKERSNATRRNGSPVGTGGADYCSRRCHRHVVLDREWLTPLVKSPVLLTLNSLTEVLVNQLNYTFGRRLRAAGVSLEDRQDLLGHKFGRITTHYSQAELGNLIAAADWVCGNESRKSPALVIIKRKTAQAPQKQLGGSLNKSVVGATGFEPATT